MALRSSKGILIWLTVVSFYIYQYSLRILPNILPEEIRSYFLIGADQFATFTSLYFLGYSIAQIPLGILGDKFGIAKVAITSLSICILGSAFFAYTDQVLIAQFARFITGIGAASASACAFKAASDLLPEKFRGFFLGSTLSLGTVGAFFSTKLIVNSLSGYGWSYTVKKIWIIGFFLFAIITLILLSVKIPRTAYKYLIKDNKEDKSFVAIFKDPRILVYGLLSIGFFAPISAMTDLWGSSFLALKLGISTIKGAEMSMNLYLGLAFGSVVVPLVTDIYKKYNKAFLIISLMILLIFCVLIYYPNLQVHTVQKLLLLIGILSGAEMSCFSAALKHGNNKTSGKIIGIVNTCSILGIAVLQQVIGILLDFHWNLGEKLLNPDQTPLYDYEDFFFALSSITILMIFSSIIALYAYIKKY